MLATYTLPCHKQESFVPLFPFLNLLIHLQWKPRVITRWLHADFLLLSREERGEGEKGKIHDGEGKEKLKTC